jgi:hypothetical protein
MLLGDLVLALPGPAVDHRDAIGLAPRLDAAREPARHPHQVRIVQVVVRTVVPAPPPGPEPARVMAQREEGVQHDPVHAVIAAGQQVAVPGTEVIGHPPTVRISGASRQPDCPKGHSFRAKSRTERSGLGPMKSV